MSLTTTYLDLVNDVLVRLREAQVASVSQNTYSALIGKLVNDAKREVEDSWNWDTLRNTISFTTQQGTFNYNLANAGNKFRVIAAHNDTDDIFLQYRPTRYFIQQLLLTQSPQQGAKAIEESGEDGGISVSSQYGVANKALADAIAIEAARRPDEETVWYPS